MAKKDYPVTLEMVRGAAEAAAREHNCSIQELTNTQVRGYMPHGSDGCVAAFLRQVKIEDVNAQKFDLNTFSTGFRATIVSEIRRFVDAAVEAERMEARVTEEMFNQICKDLDLARENIETLQSELATCNSQKSDEIRRIELDLAAVRERLASTEEAKSTLEKARDTAIGMQEEAREEVNKLKFRLEKATGDFTTEQSLASSLQQRLVESEREREAAAQMAALAEQRAAHAEATATEQKNREKELHQEISQMKIDKRELEGKISELLDRAGKAETRAAVAEAQLNHQSSTQGTTLASDTQPPKAPGGTGKRPTKQPPSQSQPRNR